MGKMTFRNVLVIDYCSKSLEIYMYPYFSDFQVIRLFSDGHALLNFSFNFDKQERQLQNRPYKRKPKWKQKMLKNL
jgi:hypothetical protein